MIQRIQSVYLLISMVITGMYLVNPLAELLGGISEIYVLRARGFYLGNRLVEFSVSMYPIWILIGAILLLSLITLFLFKRRTIQSRLCIYNIILKFGLLGMLAFLLRAFSLEYATEAVKLTIVAFAPLVAALFDYLAFRNIRKDEALVRSIDRIR